MVVRARHLESGCEYAVKSFMMRAKGGRAPPHVDSVKTELQCLERLQGGAHENVANLVEKHEGPYEIHAILQYCSGGTLHRYLQTRGHGNGMDEAAAAPLICQVGEALTAIHKMGVVHRDVKPGTVCFADGARESVKLVDFGFATFFRVGAEGGTTCRKLKTLCGSPAYMAPELVRGGQYIGPPVDVWALGCVAYELLHNRPAFRAESMQMLNLRILKGSHEKFAETSSKSKSLIRKLLVTDASDRPSANAATRLIREAYDLDDPDAPPSPRMREPHGY